MKSFIISILNKYRAYFISYFCIAIIAAILGIAVEYGVKNVIDSAGSPRRLLFFIILFLILKLAHHLSFFARRIIDYIFSPKIFTEVTRRLYVQTMNHSLYWFDSHMSGDISNKISSFVGSFGRVQTYLFGSIMGAVGLIAAVFVLSTINWGLSLSFFLWAITYGFILYFLFKKQARLLDSYNLSEQKLFGSINDSISNVFGIKCIGNQDSELNIKINASLEEREVKDTAAKKYDTYYIDCADTAAMLILATMQTFLLFFLYLKNAVTVGDFAFVFLTIITTGNSVGQITENILFTINPGIAAMKSAINFIYQKPDIIDKPEAKAIDILTGSIQFKDVCFSYPNRTKLTLSNFNLNIPHGQKIGIVGKSGAGKTTIIKSILRYLDIKSGDIKIGDHSIFDITQDSLRKNISIIPQDITMFHRTIAENISIAKQNCSMGDVIKSCKMAMVHDDIISMPSGYDSIVGERGVKLSGGQRQRIAIARAILKNAPLLILDEATSSLDSHTELLIQKSISDLFNQDKTTVIAIAHRLSTIKNLDRVIVLDDGKIIEDGTFDELIKINGKFKQMWDNQFNGMIL